MTVVEGQQVGNYRVLQRIGTGGMGAVYLAEHPVIGKKVALKVIHRDLAGNREVISRFYQEARAVTLIGNEHIVEIHDFGQSAEGDHFFIMEYLDGQTLAQLLTSERVLDPSLALYIAAQIADALCAAHQAGIIHRDLKPDNVMLCNRLGDPYFVKLLDFGLAKMFVDGGARNLTAQGVVLGTPQYMSPEACESRKDIDHRTDIYALGVLVFQMLTGQVPFDGQTMGEVLIKQVMHAPPAPRALNPNIPPSVEQVILRCLAKAPDGRFATMTALREALLDPDRYLARSPPVMPAAMPSPAAQAVTMFGVNQAAAAAGAVARMTGPVSAQTGMMTALPPSAASEPTMMQDSGEGLAARLSGRVAVVDGSGPIPVPGTRRMSVVMPAQNQTMVIATPYGFKSRPPRPRAKLLIGIAIAAAVVLTTVIVALVVGGGEPGPSAHRPPVVATPAAADAGAAAADAGAAAAAVAATDAAPPAAKLARITITSEPSGAQVFDQNGRRLGETPTEIGVAADGRDYTFTLRHPQTRERQKTITATGDMTVSVILERLPAGRPTGKPRTKARRHETADMMAPDL